MRSLQHRTLDHPRSDDGRREVGMARRKKTNHLGVLYRPRARAVICKRDVSRPRPATASRSAAATSRTPALAPACRQPQPRSDHPPTKRIKPPVKSSRAASPGSAQTTHPPSYVAKQVKPPAKWRCSPSDEGLHGAICRRLEEAHLHRRGVFESVRAVGAELATKQST